MENRNLTILGLLQVFVILAGTFAVQSVARFHQDWSIAEMPFAYRAALGGGLWFLSLPLAWLLVSLWRSLKEAGYVEQIAWRMAGGALLLFLVLAYLGAIMAPYLVVGPLQGLR